MVLPVSISGRRHFFALLTAAVVALGIGLRIWNLTTEPLWLDEGYSAYAASKSFDFLWNVVPRYETHPPLYYSLVRLWTLAFGNELFALRLLSFLSGTAVIGLSMLAAREINWLLDLDLAGRRILVAASAMLMALATIPIEMAREVRPYSVIMLVYSGLILLLFRLARRVGKGEPLWGRDYILYLLLLVLVLWLHNMGALYAIAVGTAFLTLCLRPHWTIRDWITIVGGHCVVLLLWLPALLILSDQAPEWIRSTWLWVPPPHQLFWDVVLLFVSADTISLMAAMFLIGLAVAELRRQSQGMRTTAALLILMFLPVILSIAISLIIAPVFMIRVFSSVAVPGVLLLALGVATASPPARISAFVALMALLTQMTAADILQRRIRPVQDWYGAVTWLKSRIGQDDVVFAYPNEGALPFRFAARDLSVNIPTRPIPTDMPTLDGGPGAWNPTGSRGVFALPPNTLQAIADEPANHAVPTVWLLRMGSKTYDPGDHFLRALERSRVRVGRFLAPPIDIIGLRRKDLPPVAAAEQAKP